jgi:hypothetical protein
VKNEVKVWAIRWLLIPVIVFSLAARLHAAGWLIVVFGVVVYLPVILLHCLIHYSSIRATEPVDWTIMLAIGISHLLFIAAFLLQYDYSDGPGGWLTITALLKGLEGGEINSSKSDWNFPLINLLVFIPVCISWYPLKRNRKTAEG